MSCQAAGDPESTGNRQQGLADEHAKKSFTLKADLTGLALRANPTIAIHALKADIRTCREEGADISIIARTACVVTGATRSRSTSSGTSTACAACVDKV